MPLRAGQEHQQPGRGHEPGQHQGEHPAVPAREPRLRIAVQGPRDNRHPQVAHDVAGQRQRAAPLVGPADDQQRGGQHHGDPRGHLPGLGHQHYTRREQRREQRQVPSAAGTAVCHIGHSPTAATAVANGISVPSITHSVRRLMAAAGR